MEKESKPKSIFRELVEISSELRERGILLNPLGGHIEKLTEDADFPRHLMVRLLKLFARLEAGEPLVYDPDPEEEDVHLNMPDL